jgi:hypothetical protein
MPIRVICPNGHRIVASDDKAGKTGKCPACKAAILIPDKLKQSTTEVAKPDIFDFPESVLVGSSTGDNFFDSLPPLDSWGEKGTSPSFPQSVNRDAVTAGPFDPVLDQRRIPQLAKAENDAAEGSFLNKRWLFKNRFFIATALAIVAGIFCGLLFILISRTNSSQANNTRTTASTAKVESDLLLNLVKMRLLEQFDLSAEDLLKPESSAPAVQLIEKQVRDGIEEARKIYPDFLKVTKSTLQSLEKGESDEEIREQLLFLATKHNLLHGGTVNPPSTDDPVAMVLSLHQLCVMWREHLLNLHKLTSEQWELIQEVEARIFGEHSLAALPQSSMSIDSLIAFDTSKDLKQLAIAMFNHESVNKELPNYDGMGDERQALLSWRVWLLPFLNEKELFDQFNLDEPWDSTHNLKLLDRMPKVFGSATSKSSRLSVYQMVLGDRFVAGSSPARRLNKISDGAANTILLVRCADSLASEWTKPGGIKFDPSRDAKQIRGEEFEDGIPVVFCDGSLHMILPGIQTPVLQSLFDYADKLPTAAIMEKVRIRYTRKGDYATEIFWHLKELRDNMAQK